MTRNYRVLSILIAMLVLPMGAANAEGYIGMKFGPMLVDIDGLDDPLNAGIVFGSSISGGGLEGEISTSLVKGGADGLDLTITTLGLYGVYRSEGEGAFFKAKAGFVNEDVKFESCCGSVSGDDSGSSFGIGFGSRSGGSTFEIEFVIIEQDVNFLSLGILY